MAQGLDLSQELPPRGSAGMLGLDGGLDFLGVILRGLTATGGVLGLGGHRAKASAETGRGIGDPGGNRYLEHGGWSVLSVGRVSNRTQEVHPPRCQEGADFAASTVKSRSP